MKSNRRSFLKSAGLISGALLATSKLHVHASSDDTIRIALVGCGGRGGGAAVNALHPKMPVKLVAMADAFPERLNACYQLLSQAKPDKVDVPEDRRFAGLDGYKHAIDALRPGDVVLLATPPGFRPSHVEYAVKKGVHVFMEKPFATDSPGTRRIQAAAKLADEKNVKIASGLMWRHSKARQEAVERIRQGEIGDVVLLRGFRMQDPVRVPRPRLSQPEVGEIAYQIHNFHYFDWAGGNLYIDACIHNVDVACWVKGMWPVSAVGMGGRSNVPPLGGMAYDSFYTEFTFADGTVFTSHCRFAKNCYQRYSDYVMGTKGSGLLMESYARPNTTLYKGFQMDPGKKSWAFDKAEPNPYEVEQELFFDAIINDKPYNEGHRAAEAQFASLLSRSAIYSGQIVTWDQIVNSEVVAFPDGIDDITWDSKPPLLPDDQGNYPFPIPGQDVQI